jgi:hypothetical protein
MAHEQRRLERERELFDGAPRGPRVDRRRQRVQVRVQRRVAAARQRALGDERLQAVRLP